MNYVRLFKNGLCSVLLQGAGTASSHNVKTTGTWMNSSNYLVTMAPFKRWTTLDIHGP